MHTLFSYVYPELSGLNSAMNRRIRSQVLNQPLTRLHSTTLYMRPAVARFGAVVPAGSAQH